MPAEHEPQFSITKTLEEHFNRKGIASDKYRPLTSFLNSRINELTKIPTVLAVGLVGVPGSSGLASYLVSNDGYVINPILLWDLPKEVCNPYYLKTVDPTLKQIDDMWYGDEANHSTGLVAFGVSYHVSTQDYPTHIDLQKALSDDHRRRSHFTETVGDDEECEFWGLVTMQQLREEFV